MAREEHQAHCPRGTKNEELELSEGLVGSQLMVIVDHKPHLLLELAEVANQALHDGPATEVRCPGQRPHDLGSRPRAAQSVRD